MEYFQVKADLDFTHGISIAPLTSEELSGKKPVVRRINLSENFEASVFADYMTTRTVRGQYHLISDSLKSICARYNKYWEWVPINLIDQYRQCYLYWFWNAKKVDCLSDKTEYNMDKSVKTLAINGKSVGVNNNFMVEAKIENIIVVRLDLAESMLRRGLIGFQLEKVLTVG